MSSPQPKSLKISTNLPNANRVKPRVDCWLTDGILRSQTAEMKKKQKKLPPPDLSFFNKLIRINPEKIRAMNIRNMRMNPPPPFKLNLGSYTNIPVKFADDVPLILRLPEKIRVKIFLYIPSPERTQILQLVSRKFRDEIRLRVGVQCHLHEYTRRALTFMRDVIVDSIVVGKYSPEPFMSPNNLIFRPKNVKELIFTEPISIQHLDAFLLRCNRINRLAIQGHVLPNLVPSTPSRKETQVYEWRTLQTVIKFPPPLFRLREVSITLSGPQRSLEALPQYFEMLNPKFLRRLAIKIGGAIEVTQTTDIHLKVLILIQRFHHLTHVLVSTDQNRSLGLNQHEFLGMKRSDVLAMTDSLRLRELILTEASVSFHTWIFVMLAQTKLEVFQVLHLTACNIIQKVVEKNSATLRKVAINVAVWEKGVHVPLDLTVFRKCVSLQELYICIEPGPMYKGQPDIINFFKLPSTLGTFLLKNGSFVSKDFQKIVKKLKNLRFLGVQSTCGSTDYGIKSGTVRRLLRIRKLDELFISYYQIQDVIGLWTAKTKIKEALKTCNARVPGKSTHVHFGCKENRWIKDQDNDYTCTLLTEWGA